MGSLVPPAQKDHQAQVEHLGLVGYQDSLALRVIKASRASRVTKEIVAHREAMGPLVKRGMMGSEDTQVLQVTEALRGRLVSRVPQEATELGVDVVQMATLGRLVTLEMLGCMDLPVILVLVVALVAMVTRETQVTLV